MVREFKILSMFSKRLRNVSTNDHLIFCKHLLFRTTTPSQELRTRHVAFDLFNQDYKVSWAG
jgi:hypothetical protein